MFSHILNWKLLKGSHEFPGKDGGTCINEAAIVAAGFKYRAVRSANDCPPCFSKVISAYAIGLNDRMPDDVRQKLLLPFVTRLAGTADTDEIEKKRAEFIMLATINRILPQVLNVVGLHEHANACEKASDLTSAYAAARDAADAAYAVAYAAARAARAAADAAVYAANAAHNAAAAYAARTVADNAAAVAAEYAANAANAADAATRAAAKQIWQITVEILDEAIKMGKHEEIEVELASTRMKEIIGG